MDLSSVTPSLSGPKRPHDRVSLSNMKQDFIDCLNNKVGFKGFGIPEDEQSVKVPLTFEGQDFKLSHGKIFNMLAQLVHVLHANNTVPKFTMANFEKQVKVLIINSLGNVVIINQCQCN